MTEPALPPQTPIFNTADKAYSVFISDKPYGSGNINFIYLCSDASLDYNVNYASTTTGVLGQPPDKAIFVDGASGAVGNISISGTRCNPATSVTANTLQTTQMSNAQLYTTMRSMLTANQMFQGAYILRIYNVDWSDVNAYSTYRDLYVHISKFEMDIDWQNTSDASISLTCYRRNRYKGFGDA